MIATIPVLEDMNGYFLISMYVTGSEGSFKKTGKRPFRVLSGLIDGVSAPIGTIECNPRTKRSMITWRSPSVLCFSERRPQSVYQFFRDKLSQRKFYIATTAYSSSRTKVLNLHEIRFKAGVSPGVKKIFGNKFSDAMQIWGISKYASRR